MLWLDYDLHLAFWREVVNDELTVCINYINVERLASVIIPNLNNIVQPVKRRNVVGCQHIINGRDCLLSGFVVAEKLAVIASFGMGKETEIGDIVCRIEVVCHDENFLQRYIKDLRL